MQPLIEDSRLWREKVVGFKPAYQLQKELGQGASEGGRMLAQGHKSRTQTLHLLTPRPWPSP